MHTSARILAWIGILWLAWIAAWWTLAFWRKPVRQRGDAKYELGHRVLLIAGALMIWRPVWFGPLRARPYAPPLWLLWAGLAAVLAGMALTFWARFSLGGNWSGRIVLKTGHELIRRGPYARIRHPIYTGILLALLGTVAALSSWSGWLGLALAFLALTIKARGEEKLLAPVFGAEFAEHLRRTGRFLPRLRRDRQVSHPLS